MKTYTEKEKVEILRNAQAMAGKTPVMTNEINPHMPQYIVKAPWYLNQTENSLKHQKAQIEVTKIPITVHTEKGFKNEPVYKFRKGACENCGSMTHKIRECCERPRKRGARFTGKDFRPDEYIYEVPLDYEGKRDRWNGYDPDTHKKLIYEYEKMEEEKRKIRDEKMKITTDDEEKRHLLRDEDLEEVISSDEENDVPLEFKEVVEKIKNLEEKADRNCISSDQEVLSYLEELKVNPSSFPKTIKDIPKKILYQMCTSKSLHIGDDYSKYLLNLALNSAYYDGKSRSMRENPNPAGTSDLNTFKGENYIRKTGDTLKLLEVESFVEEANEKNKDLNLNNISMPSQAELFYRYIHDRKSNYKSEKLKKAIAKYGGENYLDIPDTVKQMEGAVEDGIDSGNIHTAKNSRKPLLQCITNRSIYQEDVYLSNHTSVWGSFYHPLLGWGFKCCCSNNRSSTCSGEAGKKEKMGLILSQEKKERDIKTAEKQKLALKEEQLTKLNEKEEREGVFTEIFDVMNQYESTGHLNGSQQLIGKKTERK